jgi:hypothetical protein
LPPHPTTLSILSNADTEFLCPHLAGQFPSQYELQNVDSNSPVHFEIPPDFSNKVGVNAQEYVNQVNPLPAVSEPAKLH